MVLWRLKQYRRSTFQRSAHNQSSAREPRHQYFTGKNSDLTGYDNKAHQDCKGAPGYVLITKTSKSPTAVPMNSRWG